MNTFIVHQPAGSLPQEQWQLNQSSSSRFSFNWSETACWNVWLACEHGLTSSARHHTQQQRLWQQDAHIRQSQPQHMYVALQI
jgi:hypothetical protein